MSEQKAESPVSRGWSPTSFWDAILRLLPSKPPVNGRSFEFGPDALDQPRMDILHHLAASQPVTSHEADEPIFIQPIDGLPDLSGQIKDKGAFPDSIGGFSDVWKCIWIEKNNMTVAVKAIRIQGNVKDREKKSRRLCREAKIWATLEDVHILPLLGLTLGFGPLPALVCEWVENGPLYHYLELHKDLALGLRLHILQGLVSAVSYLHSKEVVHGDITGSNILIDGRGEPLLSDFGLSFLHEELTGNSYFTSCKPGNVRWAAPELLIPSQDGSSCRACVKSDIYSVGCVMLQVLSGRVPYDIWTDFMVISEKFNGKEPPRPSEPPIDNRHWEFMRRCWRKKQERSVTVNDIAGFIKRELGSLGGCK